MMFISAIAAYTLFIPSIELREQVTVCPSGSWIPMERCIEQYDVTSYPTLPVLLGHDYRKLGRLHELKRGDLITYGRVKYRVARKRIVSPKATWILNDHRSDLRIQTCHGDMRLIIFANYAE